MVAIATGTYDPYTLSTKKNVDLLFVYYSVMWYKSRYSVKMLGNLKLCLAFADALLPMPSEAVRYYSWLYYYGQ
jgi:hypothetical protein